MDTKKPFEPPKTKSGDKRVFDPEGNLLSVNDKAVNPKKKPVVVGKEGGK